MKQRQAWNQLQDRMKRLNAQAPEPTTAPQSYAEVIWREEADAALRSLAVLDKLVTESVGSPGVSMWEAARICTQRHLCALERIRAATGHTIYLPLVQRLRAIEQEHAS